MGVGDVKSIICRIKRSDFRNIPLKLSNAEYRKTIDVVIDSIAIGIIDTVRTIWPPKVISRDHLCIKTRQGILAIQFHTDTIFTGIIEIAEKPDAAIVRQLHWLVCIGASAHV